MVKPLSKKDFLESFRNVPRLAICILVKNSKGEILLTKRNIPPRKGYWHYPGGFLLLHEPISECLKRIAQKELELTIDTSKAKLLGIFENLRGDIRAHVIDAIYEYKTSKDVIAISNSETQEAKFFKSIPSKVFPGHQQILKKLGYN